MHWMNFWAYQGNTMIGKNTKIAGREDKDEDKKRI